MLEELLNKLTATFDSLSSRYDVSIATEDELEECFAIRDTVFGEELKRKNITTNSPTQKDCIDDDSIIIIGKDRISNNAVGTLRMTPSNIIKQKQGFSKQYQLHRLPEKIIPKTMVCSRLCVLEPYRHSPLAMLLASECYRYCLENDFVLSTILCEPNLYLFYRALGFRPLGRVYNSQQGGYRLPLFLLIHDYDYLKKQQSILYRIAKDYNFPVNKLGLDWYRDKATSVMHVDPGYVQVDTAKIQLLESPLLHGISKEGKKSLLKNAMKIECSTSDRIISKSGGERTIGFVLEGMVEVISGDEVISVLGRGDIFGEISFILGIPRTANVIAAVPNTKVVLLSLSCFSRLQKEEDKRIIWHNLATILAKRLAYTTEFYENN